MNVETIKQFVTEQLLRGLDKRLTYHNIQHTLSVHEAVKFYAREEGIPSAQITLLEIAALFHDSGFLVQREEHEKFSCELAKKELPALGFNTFEIEKICKLIMATQVVYDPVTNLEMIMKDADLEYLGTDNYFEISNRLFVELKNFNLIKSNEVEWLNMQISFLKKHKYHTNAAIQLREEGKQKILHLLLQKKHV